ncbi:Increased DNA methylation 1 [Bienertia sinuspersici]
MGEEILNFRRSDELKRGLRDVIVEAELEVSPAKKHARKASNFEHTDEFFQEILTLFNTPDDLGVSGIDDQFNYGEITSESSSQSCTESGFCTVYPKDSPEHANTSGVPKIRFKIHKQSEEYSSTFSSNCTDKRGTLPSKSVGKNLNKQFKSFVAGTKTKRVKVMALFLPNGLADGTCLAYTVKGQTVLEGYKKDNGIFCNHCNNVISPSQFEAHAGMSTRKKPYQHIYTADGVTLHDIAVTLAQKGEINQTSALMNNDCVEFLSRPKSMIIKQSRQAVKKSGSRKAVKKSGVDYGGNCVLCSAHDFSVNKFDDRTVIICDQCEKEYHVGCLREGGFCDLKELPKDKWFCCNDCNRIFSSLRNLVVKGSEMIPFSETSKINKKLVEDGLSEVAYHDVQWRLLNGKHCLREDLPLLSKVIYLLRKGFDPITTIAGKDLIPMMVHGKNVSGQEFGGMYCVVLTVESAVVSAGLLRVCGRELAELPLVATRTKYQGKGFFLALFSRVETLLRSLKVEKLVLPAAENAKTMWVDRFGFREMSQETLSMYSRKFQLTGFSETVMLMKQVEQQID